MLLINCNITVRADTQEEYLAAKSLINTGVQYEGLEIIYNDEQKTIDVDGETLVDVSERL